MNYFDDPGSRHFSFESFALGLDDRTFGVISFKGSEAISKLYDFEIMLVSSKKDIDFEDMLQSQAVFTIHRGMDDDVLYNGILSEFDQLHEVNDVVFYRARLAPKLWWLTLTHHNQVFLNQSVPDFVEDALHDGGLETADIDIGTLNGYEEINYICQYDESHFNFVSRWLERQGIYYYFNQESGGEELVLTDTKFSHSALKQGSDLFYNPASGLEGQHMGESVGVFTCRQKQLPTEIILKDYNYERPSLDITSRVNVDLRGRGISYIYGEFFATPEEGEHLASIRAEELLCQKQEFFGESTVPYIMPGFTFNLNNHYRDDFNQEYLILEVTHEGNQSHLMSGGIAADAGASTNQAIYRNSFKAIPNDVQYRPQRSTEKPKISGTIHAKIDAEVDGEYAQIDEQGRYRVKLPFDINDEHMDGKGSAPIRMMQSYAGAHRGMQFPLIKGTEVLLTFIEGNPDRPVIAGAVSNPETSGPVNADNLSESVIQSGGNNRIRMEDKAGSERIVMQSPMANSWVRVGAHNDPITLNGSADQRIPLDGIYTEQGAFSTDPGDSTLTTDINTPTSITAPDGSTVTEVDTSVAGSYQLSYVSGGNSEIRNVTIFDSDVVHDSKPGNGIRIHSGGDLWFEAHDKYGEYNVGKPATSSGDISSLLSNFGTDYNPTGLLDYGNDPYKPAWNEDGNLNSTNTKLVAETIGNAHVRVSALDTFNTQEGNIYDFGGYWNYNLGNSFAEEHIDQKAKLNKKNNVQWYGGQMANPHLPAGGVASSVTVAVVTGALITGVAVHQGSAGGAVAAGMVAGGLALVGTAIGAGVALGSQSLKENPVNIGDIMQGPGSGKIKTWAFEHSVSKGVGSSFKNADTSTGVAPADKEQDPSPANDTGGPMHTDTTWVTKQFGDAYTYNRGNDISIRVGNTEEHHHGDSYEYRYGGNHEETKYNGKGTKVHWEQAGGGTSQEARWDAIGGSLLSYSYSYYGKIKYEASFVAIPTLNISTSVSTLQGAISVSAGALKIDVSVAAGMKIDVNLAAGMFVKIERKFGGEAELNEVTGWSGFKAIGLKAAQAEAMEAKNKKLAMEKLQTQMIQAQVRINKNSMDIHATNMFVHQGVMMLGM